MLARLRDWERLLELLFSLFSSAGAASSFLGSSLGSSFLASLFSAGFLAAAAAAAGLAKWAISESHLTGSTGQLTQLLQLSLVALAGSDGLLLSLGGGSLGLESGEPAVTLTTVGGLEGVLLTVDLEVELVGAVLGDVTNIGLHSQRMLSTTLPTNTTHQVEDMSGSGLVLGALGQEDETLASLASPSSDGVGDSRLLILVEDGQLLGLERLVMEVDKALRETQTPVRHGN